MPVFFVCVKLKKILLKQFMNKEFIKKYTKMGMEVGKELMEEMEDF